MRPPFVFETLSEASVTFACWVVMFIVLICYVAILIGVGVAVATDAFWRFIEAHGGDHRRKPLRP